MFLPCVKPKLSYKMSGEGSTFGDKGSALLFNKEYYETNVMTLGSDDNDFDSFVNDYSHNLHKACLMEWFKLHTECPVC